MKPHLYGTSALAAVGLTAGPASAAEPLHMELSGYYQQYFGFTDSSISGAGEEVSYQNAEVHFDMRGELDNGLKIGGRLELEGLNSGDQIDQAYLILAGGFGELRIGGINSGRYSYGWNTDGPNVGVPINSGWTSSWLGSTTLSGGRFRSVGLSTVIDASNDNQKLTYFTPRFNGFQFTGSWTPVGHNTNDFFIGQGGENTGISSDATEYTNGWDLGASYSGAFDQVGVEAQAGIAGASAPESAEALGFDDYLAYNGGLALNWGGFAVAGSFAVVVKALLLGNEQSNEGRSFNFGASYSTGPWGFSVTYFNGKEEAGFTSLSERLGDEENYFYAAAASYMLGPGLKTSLTFLHGEKQNEDSPELTVASNGRFDNDAKAVILGIHAAF